MTIERAVSDAEVLDRVLDKGIVIDAWVRVAFVGIDLVGIKANIFVASIETYNRYASEFSLPPIIAPAVKGRTSAPPEAREPASLGIVREAFDARNQRDIERYCTLLADRYLGETHGTSPPVHGRKAARQAVQARFKVLPDLHFTIEGVVATAHDVLVSWVATGTPRDHYSGRPLTAHRLTVPGCTVTRLRRGRIVHTWDYWDRTITADLEASAP